MRTWPLLSIGFGALLSLIGGSALILQRSLANAYGEVAAIQGRLREERALIDSIRSELFSTAILLRDYLLDLSSKPASADRVRLEALRVSVETNLESLERTSPEEHRAQVTELRKAIALYWRSLDPMFRWSPEERKAQGRALVEMSVVPYREAVANAVRRLGELNNQQTARRESEVLSTEQVLASDLRRIAGLSLLLGGMVALASIWRTRSLEAATAAHLLQIENSADELRRLSQKLSGAQEDERRNISRELHDEVGQMLTALSMELGNLDEFRHNPGPGFADHLEQAKRLTEETLRSIRSMSAGLRPSVLDELGLAPALRWQARAFTKSSNIPVEMHLAEDLGDMPDAHLTCIYRVVQEALTNCARHAKAKSIRVTLDSGSGTLSLIVQDDGVGFDVRKARGQGLGLLGIEERVRELGGSVRLESSPGAGTLLRCDIPKPCEVTA